MKVALCFIVNSLHGLVKEKLWREWIHHNEDIINVYFHYVDKKLIKSQWILDHSLPESVVQYSNYKNVISSCVTTMIYAFKHDQQNMWFCFLTERCVPMCTPDKFRQMFFACFDKSILKIKYPHWRLDLHTRANLKLINENLRLVHDPWFIYTRYHVHLFAKFMKEYESLYVTINNGGLSNETMFAVVLQTYGELDTDTHTSKNNYSIIGSTLMYKNVINATSNTCDWLRMATPTSPHMFEESTEEEINELKKLINANPFTLFMRKFDKKFLDEELVNLSNYNCKIPKQVRKIQHANMLILKAQHKKNTIRAIFTAVVGVVFVCFVLNILMTYDVLPPFLHTI